MHEVDLFVRQIGKEVHQNRTDDPEGLAGRKSVCQEKKDRDQPSDHRQPVLENAGFHERQLVLRNPYDDIIFERNKLGSQPSLKIDPIFDVGAVFLSADFFIGTTERHDDGITIHADPGFLDFHCFLKLWWQSVDAALEEIVFVEIQNGRQQFLQRLRLQVRWNLFREPKNNLGALGLLGLILSADRHGLGAGADANLNTICKALLVLAAAVEFYFDFVLSKR